MVILEHLSLKKKLKALYITSVISLKHYKTDISTNKTYSEIYIRIGITVK